MQASEEQSWLTASLINGPICFITYCDFPFDVSRISKFATLILQAQVDIKALVWEYYIYMFIPVLFGFLSARLWNQANLKEPVGSCSINKDRTA